MCEAFARKKYGVDTFFTPDFPGRVSLAIELSPRGARLSSQGSFRLGQSAGYSSVWLRRPSFGAVPADFDDSDRVVISRECRDMRSSFFELLCPDSLWVNPVRSFGVERAKALQLMAAQRAGFRIPPTLFGNDPAEIRSFVSAAPGPVVFKTFGSLVPTTEFTPELVEDTQALQWTPGIYQHCIEKDHEIRVTAIGQRLFSVRINSQQTARGRLDWREAQWLAHGADTDLTFEPVRLPLNIERPCRRLMKTLGLVYGAIDLIVTPREELLFLEVNPSGQFLSFELESGLPLLDAMSEMLVQGRSDYAWDPKPPKLKFDLSFLGAAEDRQRQAMAKHVTELYETG